MKSVYLDSTIPSYLHDERESLRPFTDITRTWWNEEKRHFDLWTSEATVAELGHGDYPNQSKIIETAAEIPILPPTQQVLDIAQVYIDHYLMPRVLKGDALHLAYASFYKMDFLLTWNCNHLANANKRPHIRLLNMRLNLFTPEIVTPLELFTEPRDDYERSA